MTVLNIAISLTADECDSIILSLTSYNKHFAQELLKSENFIKVCLVCGYPENPEKFLPATIEEIRLQYRTGQEKIILLREQWVLICSVIEYFLDLLLDNNSNYDLLLPQDSEFKDQAVNDLAISFESIIEKINEEISGIAYVEAPN